MKLESYVKGYEGYCKPTWINKNQVYHRMDGGVTGFFKNTKKWLCFDIKIGEEFHGIIKNDGCVYSTDK